MSNSNPIIYLLAGIAAGWAPGGLYVPENGVAVRDKLPASLNKLQNSASFFAAEQIDLKRCGLKGAQKRIPGNLEHV